MAKTKAKWIGSARRIPDLGIKVEPGDDFEIPDKVTLPGEGVLWEATTKSKSKSKEE